jgi:hypothetical protein
MSAGSRRDAVADQPFAACIAGRTFEIGAEHDGPPVICVRQHELTQGEYQEGDCEVDVVFSPLCFPDPVGPDRPQFRFCSD